MRCPNCHNTENRTDAFFCNNCGKPLRTLWKIDITPLRIGISVCCILIILIIISVSSCSHYSRLYSKEKQISYGKRYEISNLKSEKDSIRNKENKNETEYQTKINYLTNKNSRQKSEIENLKAQLPQTYKTRYPNQYLYNKCAGKYEQAKCRFPEAGTAVEIYKQEDGYGLTGNGGWIPMSHLETSSNNEAIVAKAPTDFPNEQKIKELIQSYNNVFLNKDYNKLDNFFAETVFRYFNETNVKGTTIKNRYRKYHEETLKTKEMSFSYDWNSLKYNQINSDVVAVSFILNYWLNTERFGNQRYVLRIKMDINNDYKIVGINEDILERYNL